MALVLTLLLLFFFLGLALEPLLLAVAINSFSKEKGQSVARWAVRLGLKAIYRPAITFNAADELTLKKRSYDETHDAEYIKFGGILSGVKRYLHDPQSRIHSLYGVPMALVDEHFGVVVDPRDVAIGREMRLEQENGQYVHRVDSGEQLHEAVKAVFELPRGHIGVRLPDAIRLVGGSFDSQVVDQIRDYYQKSQEPRTSTAALRQLLVPIGAFVAVVLIGMFAAGQSAGGGGGGPDIGGNSSTINIGASLVILLLSTKRPNWRDLLVYLLGLGGFGLIGVGLYFIFPVFYPLLGIPLPLGIWAIVMFGLGLAILPFSAVWFCRGGPAGMLIGRLFLIIGLRFGFEQPIIDYDDGEYSIEEYDAKDWEIEPSWYRFALTRVGFGFGNDESNWPDGTTLSHSKVEAMAATPGIEFDGGQENLPAPTDHVPTELIAVGDMYGFVPRKPNSDDVFIRTDRTTGWFLEAGQDRRLMTAALNAAKQAFGGGRKPVGDKWILGASLAAMAMGAVFDYLVFF